MRRKLLAAFFLISTFTASAPLAAQDSERLQKIEAAQEQILQKLDEIKAELEIVKVRVTMRA